MAAWNDKIYAIHWEGPFEWNKRKAQSKKKYMLYAIFGRHYVYGPDALLYIGRTKRAGGKRLDDHDCWVQEEQEVSFRIGSIKEFESWDGPKPSGSLLAQKPKVIEGIEALLIYAHQPACNSRSLDEPSSFQAIRIFNSGSFGSLLPELSYRYYMNPPK